MFLAIFPLYPVVPYLSTSQSFFYRFVSSFSCQHLPHPFPVMLPLFRLALDILLRVLVFLFPSSFHIRSPPMFSYPILLLSLCFFLNTHHSFLHPFPVMLPLSRFALHPFRFTLYFFSLLPFFTLSFRVPLSCFVLSLFQNRHSTHVFQLFPPFFLLEPSGGSKIKEETLQ